MRHQVAGRKLKRTHSHRKALLSNLATQLFEHKKIHTTEAKAKELKAFAEKLITKAKNALLRERQGLLPDKQTIDIHNRRIVGKIIRNKAVLQELFDSIAPVVENRNGGYTRVIKTGVRRGDNARTAIIELVDFSAPQDGAISTKKKKKTTTKKTETKKTEIVQSTSEEKISTQDTSENISENIQSTTEETKLSFDDTLENSTVDENIQNQAESHDDIQNESTVNTENEISNELSNVEQNTEINEQNSNTEDSQEKKD
jgi:large subunit ribosomal protein L17